ncbi:hypothetical protein NT01EI_0054 [Edwardsiella ictaluri 93-146]|uniref:Uncharacterized protein n=1 Tax=Edwardsiella ictaluri (strain 93-146) TaxID=634503 RepID=C5B9D4_EDWI9|nr:hypothetical protein NT01EI_0054 [Edwardsiella ictaluri 93-146]
MTRFYHNPFPIADFATTTESLRKAAQFLFPWFDAVYLYS